MTTDYLRLSVLAGSIALAGPAAAHVHAHATDARPGERIEITLEIGHGCAGRPTTGLRVAVPPGLEQAQALPVSGWQPGTSTAEIGWTGGPLADHDKGRFTFAATVAANAPERIAIPVVQQCADQSLRWISPEPSADNPAPTIRIRPAG